MDKSRAKLCRLDSKGIEELFRERVPDTRMDYERILWCWKSAK